MKSRPDGPEVNQIKFYPKKNSVRFLAAAMCLDPGSMPPCEKSPSFPQKVPETPDLHEQVETTK